MEYFLSDNYLHYDAYLQICQTGWERCEPCHAFGPAVRDHFLIHYVISGKGHYHVGDKCFEIGSGQGFLICPDEITYYEADEAEPWHYVWVGFKGTRAVHCLQQIGLGEEQLIFTAEQHSSVVACLNQLHEASKKEKGSAFAMLGQLYVFFGLIAETSKLPEHKSIQDRYVQRACQIIEMDYNRELSVSKIAAQLGLDRSYFSNLFKGRMGVPPQRYILNLRMDKACELLERNDELSIGDVARSVGYTEPLTFSRMFKEVKGQSPSDYKMSCDIKQQK